MSSHRFHLPPGQWGAGDELLLEGDEARHCVEVLRREPGDRVAIFDGEGREAHGEIAAVEDRTVRVRVLTQTRSPATGVRIGLAQAIPKGKNMDLIVQKATELGATDIIPVLSERTVVKLDAEERVRKQAKWQRVALEACKQCGRNLVPKVHEPVPHDAFVKEPGGWDLRLVGSLQDDARRLKVLLAEHAEEYEGAVPRSALVMVGPEGDYTPAEMSTAKGEGFLPLGLGPIILRSETAALHCLSILHHELVS